MRYQPQGLTRLDRRNPLARGLTFIKSVPGSATPATLGSAAPSGAMPVEVKLQGLATRFSGYGTPVIDTNAGQTAQGTVLVLHQSTILPPSGGYPNPGYCHVLASTASGNTVANGWLLMLGNGTGNLQFRAYDGADNGTQVVQADGSTPLNDGKPHVTIGTWDFSSGGILQTYVDGAPYAVSGAIAAAITIAQPMRLGRDRASLQFWGVFDGNMCMSMVWNRILLPAEIRSISANPWQLFEAPDEDDSSVVVADTSLTAGATAGATATGALSTSIPLSAGAAAVASALGTLSTSVRLTAAAAAVATGSGLLATSIRLNGSAGAQAAAGGLLTTGINLVAAASANASASGTLSGGAAQLAGAAIAAASASGVLSTAVVLSGAAQANAAATAALAGGSAQLAANAVAGASSSGALTTAIRLSGSTHATASASATLAGGGAQLSGAAVALASASGQLITQISLVGSASASTAASGTFSGAGAQLSGVAAASTGTSGTLTTAIALAGAAIAQASASAALVGQSAALSGSASARASSSSALTTGISLVAATRAVASGQAALSTQVALVGIATAKATAAVQFAPTKPPTQRVLVIGAESRVLSITPQNRVYVVDA
jgi:hypothetical protein